MGRTKDATSTTYGGMWGPIKEMRHLKFAVTLTLMLAVRIWGEVPVYFAAYELSAYLVWIQALNYVRIYLVGRAVKICLQECLYFRHSFAPGPYLGWVKTQCMLKCWFVFTLIEVYMLALLGFMVE